MKHAGGKNLPDQAHSRFSLIGLRTRMLVGFGVVGIVSLAGLELVFLYGLPFSGFRGELEQHRKLALRQLNTVADLKKERMLHWLQTRSDDTRVLAESPWFKAGVNEVLALVLERAKDAPPPAQWLRQELVNQPVHRALTAELLLAHSNADRLGSVEVADAATGLIIASSHEADLGHSVAGQVAFTKALRAPREAIVALEKDPESGRLSLLISRAIGGADQACGVLIMRQSPREGIFPSLETHGALGRTGEALLLNQNGLLLAPLKHPLSDGSRAEPLVDAISPELAALAAARKDTVTASIDYRGVPVMAAVRQLPVGSGLQWVLVVKQDKSEIFADLWASVRATLWIDAGGLILLLGLSFAMAHGLASPIQRLSQTAAEVAAGNLNVRAPVVLPGELGLLARTFNTMVGRVQQWHGELQTAVKARTAELEHSNARLMHERDNFRRVMDSMQDGVYVVNQNHEIEYVNPALEKEFGPVDSRKCHAYFHGLPDACAWCTNERVWQGESVQWEWRSPRSGKIYDLLDTPLVNAAGGVSKLEIRRDITARKRSEEALRAAEQRFKTVADFTYDWEYWRSPEGEFLYMSPSCERITGYTREEFIAHPALLVEIVHPDDRALLQAHSEQCKNPAFEDGCQLEFRIRRRDGKERWIGHVCRVVHDAEGRFLGRRAANRDMTERKQTEEALRRAHDNLERRVIERTSDLRGAVEALKAEIAQRRSLEARILEISEREQRRIGQDLHDGLCQQLTGIAHLCNVAYQQIKKIAPEDSEIAGRAVELVQETIVQSHQLARGLFPVGVEAGGLAAALDELVANLRKLYLITIRFECEGAVFVEDNAAATHLYRIAQEALSNALKHAQATEVVLRVAANARILRLSVTDNGRGLPPASDKGGFSSMGLETMRFRARSIGGELQISRGRNGGTIVSVELPAASVPSQKESIYDL